MLRKAAGGGVQVWHTPLPQPHHFSVMVSLQAATPDTGLELVTLGLMQESIPAWLCCPRPEKQSPFSKWTPGTALRLQLEQEMQPHPKSLLIFTRVYQIPSEHPLTLLLSPGNENAREG